MQEAEYLKSQVNNLCALFAKERSNYESLLSPSTPPEGPAIDELSAKLGEQRSRVGNLRQQLDYIIVKLADLQDVYDTADDADKTDAGPPFCQNNERDDASQSTTRPVSCHGGSTKN